MPGDRFRRPNMGSVSQSRFAMVPRADIPRSAFQVRSAHKTTFDAGYLIPIYLDEVLPGDSHRMSSTMFCRLSTAVFPIMDNLYLDTFWFFVPCRLLWENWEKFMGERTDPSASIDYEIPVCEKSTGYGLGTIQDYFGLPLSTQANVDIVHNALPIRAYKLIYNEWFRDQNLEDPFDIDFGDGPDEDGNIQPKRRGKRHDYFTSCLPWPQKGDAVNLPLQGTAPIMGLGVVQSTDALSNVPVRETARGSVSYPWGAAIFQGALEDPPVTNLVAEVDDETAPANPQIFADLSDATAVTINALRTAFQVQRLLERDARGGTRYTEIIFSHFGVKSPDARLQRPEYLGGNSTPISINPVAQTSQTATTPLGNLAGVGTGVHATGFSQSFTEHGWIIGIANVRAELTYQQGKRRLWDRKTRYDIYWPAFAHLGEQAVLRQEIYYVGGDPAESDHLVFGYQERWAEYRYHPSLITGKFRSGISGSLDSWHLAQYFSNAPTLSDTFIREFPPMQRVLAGGAATDGQQFLFDAVFDCRKVRPMPTYSVPGFIDRF